MIDLSSLSSVNYLQTKESNGQVAEIVTGTEEQSNLDTWAKRNAPQFTPQKPIAYFSIEYGLHPCLPIYSGGLGILAADHLKSASDLGLPIVAVGLLYHEGYFQQHINSDGFQEEHDPEYSLEALPLELCKNEQGEELTVTVHVGSSSVKAQVWLVRVGCVNLYLLDANRPDNQPSQQITKQLYGGGKETRIAQEMLLGIGGVRLLQQLGLEPQVYHLNEGHAAFALVELARQIMEHTGQSFEQVKEAVRSHCVFTTHTPVPAGHDTFTSEQIEHNFDKYWAQLGLESEEFLNLGRQPDDPDRLFNMTVLALRLCQAANGVSKLNGEVCRQMWSSLYPNLPVEQIPITSITNGVHTQTWVAPLMADLYDRHLHPDWTEHLSDRQMWAKVDKIPDVKLWSCRQQLKENLIAYVRSQVKQSKTKRGESAQVEHLLDPKVLTFGFARRFSTYKRADLIFHDLERAKQLFKNSQQPIQMIFAGKAHPADEQSKRIIQRLIEWSQDPAIRDRLIFLENYDMYMAEKLVQGVDVWLNTPRRPQEASGTSGQKAALNGGIHCSILDGWWAEAYQAGADGGPNGWAIGNSEIVEDKQVQDERDADALYSLLEQEIIPCYYDRNEAGLPERWLQMMKHSIKTIAPQFNTERMVIEYVTKMYLPRVTGS